jgi:hypothetical protein
MKLLPLKDINSFWAFQSFHKLMLGLKMLPSYMGEQYEEFYARVEEMPDKDKEKLIREALIFVPLERSEILPLISFVTDDNGIPYGEAQLSSISPDKLFNIMAMVCIEISKIKVNFLNEPEKKN